MQDLFIGVGPGGAAPLPLDCGDLGIDCGDGGVAETVPLHLGPDRMTRAGVNPVWLLQAAAQIHWRAVLGHTGLGPRGLTDLDGSPVLGAVAAFTLAGRGDRFGEGERASLEPVERPRPETGWRSLHVLRGVSGASMTVELVTAFARRGRHGARALGPAAMPPELALPEVAEGGRRTRLLVARGNALREAVEQAEPRGLRTVRGAARPRMPGANLLYFAGCLHALEIAEQKALAGRAEADWPVAEREVHFLDNLEEGDWLELGGHAWTLEPGTDGSIACRTIARRRSDSTIVAVSESHRRPA